MMLDDPFQVAVCNESLLSLVDLWVGQDAAYLTVILSCIHPLSAGSRNNAVILLKGLDGTALLWKQVRRRFCFYYGTNDPGPCWISHFVRKTSLTTLNCCHHMCSWYLGRGWGKVQTSALVRLSQLRKGFWTLFRITSTLPKNSNLQIYNHV